MGFELTSEELVRLKKKYELWIWQYDEKFYVEMVLPFIKWVK
jgi:hypothetical protein